LPEGAECKIIGEGLAKFCSAKILTSITTISGRYTKSQIPDFNLMQFPAKIIGVGTKGKLIFVIFDNDMFLLSTLGMTGSWTSKTTKHTRMSFDFSDGTKMFFNDVRNFGTLKFVKGRKSFLEKLYSLGPDMLSEIVTDDMFNEALDKKPHWAVAKAIMDQTVISGVGNYVKAEALYHAKISPKRLVGSLTTLELQTLNKSIQYILSLSYASGGASIKDYFGFDSQKGTMTEHFKVYGKKTDPLGNPVIKELTDDGRTTHWVQKVQV
jgi:formamidopyrimidine-DNA glycosylase